MNVDSFEIYMVIFCYHLRLSMGKWNVILVVDAPVSVVVHMRELSPLTANVAKSLCLQIRSWSSQTNVYFISELFFVRP